MKTEITPELVREILDYDPKTGILTWRERGRHWFKSNNSWSAWNKRHAGKRAGYIWTCSTGFKRRQIKILRRGLLEHRIVWMWMTDAPLPEEIDHENRDGTDNRWRNLRASSQASNRLNLSMSISNKSGVTGVHWNRGAGKWHAQCTAGGKHHYLGLFESLDDAAQVVSAFRAKQGFSPTHGAEIARYHR